MNTVCDYLVNSIVLYNTLKFVHGFSLFFPDSYKGWSLNFTGLLFHLYSFITQSMSTVCDYFVSYTNPV